MTANAWSLGYGTNGFNDHSLASALDVIGGNGYTAVALTIGHPHLDPFAEDWQRQTRDLAAELTRRKLRVVVETGARYTLDPWRKHRPTLVDRHADRRMAFLRRAIEIAVLLDADCVSLWSGVLPDDLDRAAAWELMAGRLRTLATFASDRGVTLSIEPEPGMVVETVSDALQLIDALGRPENVGITVDLGHCVAVEPDGVVGALRSAGPLLRNVQIDDMKPGVHEHLELGAGELDISAAIATLREIGFSGVAAVELPRHSHDAPRLARECKARWDAAAATTAHPWTARAVAEVRADPSRATRLFAEAGRQVGRVPIRADDPHGYAGTADDSARAEIIVALAAAPTDAAVLHTLYDHGDDAERRGVMRGLGALTAAGTLPPSWRLPALEVTADALRTNDPRLAAAAMGDFAAAELDDHAWRHGILKLLFMGVPLAVASGLEDRRDAELSAMAARYAEERRAAGRTVPDDLRLLDATTQEK